MHEAMVRLVESARRGDKDAFARLSVEIGPRMYNLAFRLTGKHADAEDVLQEAFAKAYARIGTLRHADTFESWFYTIVLNQARMQFRFRKKFKLVEELPQQEAPAGLEPPAQLATREREEWVHRALQRLPGEQREVLVLHDIEGVKHEEIAKILGVSLGTVWSRLFYARNKLKEMLGSGI